MECQRRSRTASDGGGLGFIDMNAVPPRDFDGDGVGVSVSSDLAFANTSFKMQDTCDNPFTNMQIAQMNLDVATKNANLVYLQALKDYISERRGVLGDGWRVKFEYADNICKNFPIYCGPDGSRFDSMQKVAQFLGLLSGCNSFVTNDSWQNGSHATKNMHQASSSISRANNRGNAVEIDTLENGNCGSESSFDGFPVQFQDFFITLIGKIDPKLSFQNGSQIWPIGYKSIWHDKLTGSIFIFNVLKGDENCGLIFRVNRHPCSKKSIPNASTVIYKPKCGPSDEISSCLTTETQSQSQHLRSDIDFMNGDVIGEFSVEGRSPSSVWQIVLETFLFACRQTFQDLKFLNFCCNHRVDFVESQHFYGIDSLDKFGCLTGQTNSIPRLILTPEQLEVSCMVFRRWLQMDRFGLDAEFVQELIQQQLSACSGYKSLDARCRNSIGHTVGSGFFTVLRKYHSQPIVSDGLTRKDKRLCPPGNAIASNLPSDLSGHVLQAYEFSLRFHKVLGQEAPLSRQKLEYGLLNPCVNDLNSTIAPDTKAHDGGFAYTTKESEGYSCQLLLSNFHMAMLKVVVEEMLAKFVIKDPSCTTDPKSRKGRKKNMEFNNNFGNKMKIGLFPVNEITWPELARRYILVLLSLDDKFEDLDITNREFDEMFRCLNGDGGSLCSSLTGMAAIEADAVVLAEASKKVFSCVKSKMTDFIINKEDLNINDCAVETKKSDIKCPEWIKFLEPVRKLPTNVGAKIRNRVRKSLEKGPPEWATKTLLESISKDIYKGNAAGPTKKLVVGVLDKVRYENPLTKKKAKESRAVKTVFDVIAKRCRMVLRSVAAEDENKSIFGLLALKPNESDDVINPATVSRPLDFRTIDLRLDAGFYADSQESFIEDVHEVWQILRIRYRRKPKYLDLLEKLSTKLQDLYEQEVVTLVNKIVNCGTDLTEETKTMLADTISSTLFVAPWEEGICKICGKDENDHVLLLCDRCDAEYHTYCLDPPLQRIPKSSWYCPPCILFITSQSVSKQDDPVKSQLPEKKREFTRNGLEMLADLADTMESVEYWDLGIKERVFLLQFLCDEALSSSFIRVHINSDGCDARRNFLGRDWAGRLYWVLGRPERLFVSGPHSEGEVCESSSEFDSWSCYESDAEVGTLIEWLDGREKELKESIINWQKNKLNDQNGQPDLQVNCSSSTLYYTNARAELEKKYGLFSQGEIGKGKIVHDGKSKIKRCDCLEPVGPGSTRQHCFSCHSTYFSHESHQCEKDPLKPKNKQLTFTNWVVKDPSQDNNNASFLVKHGVNSSSRSRNEPKLEILGDLKIILLDIEAALPREGFKPSRGGPDRLRVWRAFLKRAKSIYEMVQTTIMLEDMIKTEQLKKEWWYFSSASAAAKISTVSSLALKIYALDAAIFYEKPPPTEDFKSKEEAPIKSTVAGTWNELKTSRTKEKPKKKKLKASSDC